MSENKDLHKETQEEEEIPSLNPEKANEMIDHILEACDMEPSKIPLEVLESWENYKRPKNKLVNIILIVCLILVICLPVLFFKPSIIVQRTNVEEISTTLVYNVQIKSVLPVQKVSAKLDDQDLSVNGIGGKEFEVQVHKNGKLVVTATLINGQKDSREFVVDSIDDEKPKFVDFKTNNGVVTLTVVDTFSGINYSGITGLEPIAYNEDTGIIQFEIPDKPTEVCIPDKAGNTLVLLLSPKK